MEDWQEPLGPADRVGFAYLGLDRVFGAHAAQADLLAYAQAALDRAAFYRSQWVANRPCADLGLNAAQAARLRSLIGEGRGLVVCTFQIGPFLQLPFTLGALDLPVMLLMDPDNFDCGMEVCAVSGMTPGAVPEGRWPRPDAAAAAAAQGPAVRFARSSDPAVAWKMARWLKAGNVVFAYLDGNRGLDDAATDRSSESVPFFGVEIRVRKGLAYLAGSCGAPLVFLVARQEASGHTTHLSPPVRRRPGEAQDAFCRRALRAGFRLLEAHIRQDPACWSEWGQIHRWAVRSPRPGASTAAAPLSAEQALQRRLRVEAKTAQLRLGSQEVLVNHATGIAVVLTPVIRDVLRLADEGRTVEEIVRQLNGSYEEDALLGVIHVLASDAFLQVSAS